MCAMPEAQGWQARETRLAQASALEITFFVQTPDGEKRVDAVHTPAGTVGCVRTQTGGCVSLREIGLNHGIDDLVEWATAQTHAQGVAQQLPGSDAAWPLPAHEQNGAVNVSWDDWSFNPEVGMPMPGTISLHDGKRTWVLRVDRFLLRP